MAINLQNLEATQSRWGAPSEDYPQGKFLNGTGAGKRDGSFCKAEWANDIFGFMGAILRAAKVSPNGEVETAVNSQIFTALTQLITSSIESEAVLANVDQDLSEAQKEQIRGNIGAGTSSLTLASVDEAKAGTDETKAISPKALAEVLAIMAVTPETMQAAVDILTQKTNSLESEKVSHTELETTLSSKFIASTTDLEDGVSELADGTFYFVYEE